MSSVDTSTLSIQQLDEYKKKRTAYFKGTIAVTVIYGTFALIMFLIALFSPVGKTIITDVMLPFTVTFIAGMVIVVILLIIAIFAVKAPPEYKLEYDNMKCPDYWTLERTPDSFLNAYDGPERARMRYRCVKDPNGTMIAEGSQSGNTEVERQLYKVSKIPYNTSYDASPSNTSNQTGSWLSCNVVYPDYMNYEDISWDKNDKTNPNKIRCEYAKKCNSPWTSVCPSF